MGAAGYVFCAVGLGSIKMGPFGPALPHQNDMNDGICGCQATAVRFPKYTRAAWPLASGGLQVSYAWGFCRGQPLEGECLGRQFPYA